MTTTEKLARLKLYATRYEIVMSNGTESILIGYGGRSRNLIRRMMSEDHRVQKIIAKTGTDRIVYGKRAIDGMSMGDWTIRPSGRTQREAITRGELPFIGD